MRCRGRFCLSSVQFGRGTRRLLISGSREHVLPPLSRKFQGFSNNADLRLAKSKCTGWIKRRWPKYGQDWQMLYPARTSTAPPDRSRTNPAGRIPAQWRKVEPELIRFRVSRNARRGLKQSSRSETGINMSCSVTAAGAQDRTKDLGWFGRARGRYSKGRNRLPVETQPQRAQPSSRVRIRSPKRLTAWEIPILPMGTSHFPHGNFPLFLS